MSEESQFSSLKSGDRVAIDVSRYGTEIYEVRTIFRVTEKQIVFRTLREGMAPHDQRYYRDTGYSIGSDAYSRTRLRALTPELLERIEKQNLVAKFTALKWKDLSVSQLRAIKEALKTSTP